MKAGRREARCLHGLVEQLLKEVSKLLSHIRKNEPENLQHFPELASSFSLLLRAAPCLATSRYVSEFPLSLTHIQISSPYLASLPPLSSSNHFFILCRSLKIANFLCDHFCSNMSLQSTINHQSHVRSTERVLCELDSCVANYHLVPPTFPPSLPPFLRSLSPSLSSSLYPSLSISLSLPTIVLYSAGLSLTALGLQWRSRHTGGSNTDRLMD